MNKKHLIKLLLGLGILALYLALLPGNFALADDYCLKYVGQPAGCVTFAPYIAGVIQVLIILSPVILVVVAIYLVRAIDRAIDREARALIKHLKDLGIIR